MNPATVFFVTAKFVLLYFLIFLVVIGFPALAFAAGGGTQQWWQALLVTLIEVTAVIVTPIISVLVMLLLKKWNLKIEQEKIDWILDKSIGFAEQKAKNALKDGKPMEGPAIAKIAITHGVTLLSKYNLGRKFGDWLVDGIEAKLGQKKLEQSEKTKL